MLPWMVFVWLTFLVGGQGKEERAAEKPAPVGQGRLTPGVYVEVDEAGVPNPQFQLAVREVTRNILEIRGVHGWVAFASYDEERKDYRGFFEWREFGAERSPEGKWADLFQIRVIRQSDTMLYMTGNSKNHEFVIRATRKP